jgi:predicted amidohydrolase YtcJ
MKYSFVLAILICLFSCREKQHADKVILGKTWTANEHHPWSEGLAIIADTLAFVGSAAELHEWIGDQTKVIRLDEGQLIVPGFIDTHTHFIDGGVALSSVQLRDAKSPKEFISRIAAFCRTLKPGEWITAGDWDHENWGGELPTRQWIDSVTSDNPVWINRLDGHMCLANSRALREAKIDDRVNDVAGGTIVRRNGEITGIFKDNAMDLIYPVVPPLSDDQEDRALTAAMDYVAAHGVTSVHNMSGYQDVFDRAHASGKLKTRIYAGMMLRDWRELQSRIAKDGRGDRWLRVGNLKEFVDGSLGSHTAAFFKPYTDSPKDSGFFLQDENVLYKRIKSADSAGLHVMVHAIGDRAIHTLLDIFERVTKENGARDRRFRIEHAQHIDPRDIQRFHDLAIIPSMQPYHAIDDGRWADRVIGRERSKTTYPFKSLLDVQAKVAFGSDWFVAPATPLEGIYAAATRRTLDDKNPEGWVPEQKITVEQAMICYTRNAAFASFEEHVKGTLEAGKLADFVVLGRDITSIAPEEIRIVKVLLTNTGDRISYQDSTFRY